MQIDLTPLKTLKTLCLCLKILKVYSKLKESNNFTAGEGRFLNLGNLFK